MKNINSKDTSLDMEALATIESEISALAKKFSEKKNKEK